jgi:O-antigen/teichoic acid export membrane protein
VVRETLRFSALQTVAQVFSLLSNIVLARVLLPADFGIYDICGFFIGLGMLLGDAGLGASLIRKSEEPTPEEYGSILVANVVVGTVLTLGFILAAPFLARLYQLDETAVWVLMAMAAGYLIGSLKSYPMIRIERALSFSKIARIELFVLLLRQSTAVTLALLQFGVWALVMANVGGAILAVALTFVVQPGLPPFKFSAAAFRPLLVFGAKVQALTVIAFFKDNVSNAMLGALAGPSSVGFFNFAMRYIQTPLLAVNSLARVQLPTYARLQGDPSALYAALRGALRISFLIGVPFLLVLTTGAPWLVKTIWHVKWEPSIVVAYGLLPNMIGGLAASPMFTLLQARNEAGLALTTFAAWTLSTWALSILAFWLGFSLLGVAVAHSVVTVIVTTWLLARARRILGRSMFRVVGPPVVSGALGLGALAGLHSALPHVSLLHSPLVLLGAPLAVYFIAELVIEGRVVRDDIQRLRNSAFSKKGAT